MSWFLVFVIVLIVIGQTRVMLHNLREGKPKEDYSDVGVVLLCVSLLNLRLPCLPEQREVLKSWLIRHYSGEHVERRLSLFDRMLGQPVNLNEAIRRVMYFVPIGNRYMISELLFSISSAKGFMSKEEYAFVRVVSESLYVEHEVFQSLASRYYNPYQYKGSSRSSGSRQQDFGAPYQVSTSTVSAYQILGSSVSDNDESIKAAYRKAVLKYHPDRWASASEADQKKAREEFLKIQEAYDRIKKLRGFS